MSKFRDDAPAPDPTVAVDGVVAQFELAWKQSLADGPEPSVDAFLAKQPERERQTMRKELERISDRFRIQRDAAKAHPSDMHTADFSAEAMVNTPQPAPGSTVAFDAARAVDPAATIGVEVSGRDDDGFAMGRDLDAPDKTRVIPSLEEKSSAARPKVPGYEILGELGRGGMGVVYKANQIKLQRTVALKMVLAGAHAGGEQLRRFYAEAQAVAHLQHPNIVQIYEVSEQAGLPYFSLEFVDGGSLAQKAGGKPQPVQEAASVMECLSRAMEYAHRHGVVHRDLKPANVLLTAQGIPKITDFGLAKRLEDESSSQTRSGAILGTPSYMAPEQAMGEVHKIGPLTDVYALGAMLYELLTGRPPFAGPTPMETVVQVTRDEPVAPSQLQPKIPRDLETICLRCLQKEQPKRYPSAAELADDLRRFLAGEPILARPISAPERLWRWCRRNKKIASLSAAVLTLLVLGFVGSTVAAFTIAQERNAKEEQRKEAESAKTAAQIAEQRAKENAHLAEQQAVNAVDVFYRVVTKADSKLRSLPGEGMQQLRLDVLADTREGLDQVLEGVHDSPLFNRTMAALQQHIGDVYKELGRSEDAQGFYEKCRAIIESMAVDNPDSDANVYNLSAIYEKLGDVALEIDDLGVAQSFNQKALQNRLRLTQMPITDPQLTAQKVNESLGRSYLTQSRLALMLGDPVSSWDFLSRYLELQLSKRFENPREFTAMLTAGKLDPRYERVAFQLQLGELSFRLNDTETCQVLYERAFNRSRAAMAKAPERTDAQDAMASSTGAMGDLNLSLNNPSAATPYYSLSHELVEKRAAQDPDNARTQRTLSFSYYRVATAKLMNGESAEAQEAYEKCLELRRKLAEADPRNTHQQIDLMIALARCGQHAVAADVAQKLGTRASEDPSVLFQIACGYALCVPAIGHGKPAGELTAEERDQQSRYTTLALDAISAAIKQGYRDRVALEHDPDLRPIQQDSRFQALADSIGQK
jgi:serine/threonine protein kinase